MTTTSQQQIALITGGSRGLGRNSALHLARAGLDVVITYRVERADADALLAQVEALGRKAVALQLDTGDHVAFPAFAEQLSQALQTTWGRDSFDVLVNNAGGSLHATVAETTEEQFDTIFDVHVKGVFFLTQRLLPLLADGGTIVNVSSGLTRFSFPGSGAYAAAKGAVEVLTRYLALELGERGIVVNTIAPGAIKTDFSGGMVRDSEQMQAAITAETALGRVGEPADAGGAGAALVTSASRWVNGQRIEVSGGFKL